MKKFILIITALSFLSVLSAHPAVDVTLKFLPLNNNLVVVYQHPVKDNKDHYISDVRIELNGKEIISQKLTLQDTQTTGELTYKIPEAKSGDKIIVKTKCNKLGIKNGELVIEGKAEIKKEAVKDAPAVPKASVPAMPK